MRSFARFIARLSIRSSFVLDNRVMGREAGLVAVCVKRQHRGASSATLFRGDQGKGVGTEERFGSF